ncbi:MAG: adenine deaminase C-terminal domain-containing protein [Chloroflexota bacterium]
MMTCDLILANARVADVFRQRLFDGWVGIKDGRFVYVEPGTPPDSINAAETIDVDGAIVMPGLIDSHMHIESSLITPRRFAEAVLPWGTTTILSDPHEVGNVAGEGGVRWMMDASADLPLRVLHSIPSCVPATDPALEWVGEVFDADTIARLATHPTVIALGEVMDYIGLLGANPRLQGIVERAMEADLLVEGHIPTLAGDDLSYYLSQGVSSDHTLTFEAKINEQISKGVTVMLQTKSITPDNIKVVLDLPDRSRVVLITDDIEPSLLVKGHLSRMVTMAIEAGMSPMQAFAAATTYPARYLDQRRLGAIAPGYHADFMLLDDLATFPPQAVYVGGQKVAESGAMLAPVNAPEPKTPLYPPLTWDVTGELFRVRPAGIDGDATLPVVALQTKTTTLTKLERIGVTLQDGFAVFADGDDLAITAILARDGETHFAGLIRGTGFERGAFASTVAHDCHNLIVIGRDVDAMVTAARRVHEMGGGVVVADGDAVLAELDLPYFGLLSDRPVADLAVDMERVQEQLRGLGVDHSRPFLTLSIMGLSVSPYVKFTDRGIVDTETRELIQ